MALQTASLAGAALLTAASYANAKYGVGADIRSIRYERNQTQRIFENIAQMGDTCTIYNLFSKADPAADALWFEGRTWKYRELKDDVDRLAAFLHTKGIQPGDFVGVFMSNSPEMVMTMLALQKLGAVAALLNINLRDGPLEHCLGVSKATMVLSTPELSDAMCGSLPHFALSLGSFADGPAPQSPGISLVTLSDLPEKHVANNLSPAKRAPKELACLVFTSGTTGMPKACGIRNMMMIISATTHAADFYNPQKYLPARIYSALPLFHGTALFGGFCNGIGTSSCLCLARKFSASRFFKDVTESRATKMLYAGELCRYLVNSPASSYDTAHNCRTAYGNGMRPEVWQKFQERFNVPEIREFYRSTEGVGKFENNGVGAWNAGKIAFAGPIRRWFEDDTFIVRLDPQTDQIFRDPKTGFCVRCGLGEPGEVIGRVRDRSTLTEYLGNSSATEEKLIRDVFTKGDLFQKMGDLALQDGDGWVHFHDRIGDTFRWKGENVSAGEVKGHIAALPDVQDAVVYGVKLQSYDGKAGAASISLLKPDSGTSFMKGLYGSLKKRGVPAYAIPRLVRLTNEIPTGVTFKQAKKGLEGKPWIEGKDGDTDLLYWLDGDRFEKLTTEAWNAIEHGKAKL